MQVSVYLFNLYLIYDLIFIFNLNLQNEKSLKNNVFVSQIYQLFNHSLFITHFKFKEIYDKFTNSFLIV